MIKKIIVILVVLVILAAGAVAAVYFTRGGESAGGLSTTIQNIFPFGQGSNTPNAPTQTTPSENQTPEIVTPSALREISSNPSSGVSAFTTGSTTVIRFMEKATGNIYEANPNNTEIVRISNTTIPKVAEAMFLSTSTMMLRYTKDNNEIIETLFGVLATSSAAQENLAELSATYLTPYIQSLSISPDKKRVFFLTKSSGASGFIANTDGTKQSSIFNSPISEWLSQWPANDIITLTTKPNTFTQGYMYLLDTKTNKIRKVLSNLNGLTTLTNNDGTYTLYSFINQNLDLTTSLLNIKNGAQTQSLIGKTLPEKCVWSKKASVVFCAVPKNITKADYPDIWYKGLISFSDNLLSWNVETGETEILVDLEDMSGRSLDATNLSFDESEQFLVFIDKTTLTPWVVNLSSSSNITPDQ